VLSISETETNRQAPVYTLFELNSLIRSTIEMSLPDSLWVVAEIAEIRCNARGHCYLELVERKDEETIAQIKANIWAYTFRSVSSKFEKATGESLKRGMKVLLLVTVTFHEVYGLSLNIKDIDPTYSLGEMARKKREVIERLKKEGLIDLNKKLPLPLVPQKIAVVSSPTAAGYGDFVNHLRHNPYGYRFAHRLFSAWMQGQEAEESVIKALTKIKERTDLFDIAVIIRGGGSQIDLNCFDAYGLASEIARFPLPVVTGIGHERDDTVADMVAHTKCKTPTDVAQFIISGARGFEERIMEMERMLVRNAEKLLKDKAQSLVSTIDSFKHLVSYALSRSHNQIAIGKQNLISALRSYADKKMRSLLSYEKDLGFNIKQILSRENSRIEKAEQAVRLLDPVNVLKRGYSITYLEGKSLKELRGVEKGDVLTTKLDKGLIMSRVEDLRDE
jgi:exodeoxyribonuclease VII large subunit